MARSWKLRTGLLAAVLAVAIVGFLAGGSPDEPVAEDDAAAGEIIVRFDRDADAADRTEARDDAGTDIAEMLPVPGMQVVQTDPGVSVEQGVARLERSDSVAYAEPNVRRSAFVRPNDPLYRSQWALEAIAAPSAWDRTTGSRGVTVAVIDSGVDQSHPDLAPNRWRNPGETGGGRESNGVDDDGNGFRDDSGGWDWVEADPVPSDDSGHGTHVAGTVAAQGNDGTGVSGVAWQTSVLPLRVLDANGEGRVSDVIRAYAYAGAARVRIANASLGGGQFSRAERDALAAAPNTLFVVAAGNEGANNDTTPSYPCNHDLANVICVAATDRADALAGFSNVGVRNVDLAAPGVEIVNTWLGGRWEEVSGTSMATPHVAGAAALVWAQQPGATVAQVRRAVLGGADPRPSLIGRVATGGRLNAFRALRVLRGEIPPSSALAPAAQSTPSSGATGPTPPAAPAPAPAPGAAPDRAAPAARISVSRRQRLSTIRRRGVRTRVRCSEACTLRARLLLASRTARRLRLPRTIATARTGRASAGTKTFYAKLTTRAKSRLRSARSATLELRAVDPAGNARTVRSRLTITR